MSDLFKRLQAVTMLAQELHINFADAEMILDDMVGLKRKIDKAQHDASAMVSEMVD